LCAMCACEVLGYSDGMGNMFCDNCEQDLQTA
jgi:hypothetical protein